MHKNSISIFNFLLLTSIILIQPCYGEDKLEFSGKRVNFSRRHPERLYYSVNSIKKQGPLDSLNSFFNWYTDYELSKVKELDISNYNPSNGDVFPLENLKGIERLSNLKEFTIGRSGITDLDGIEMLTTLESANLLENQLTYVSGIGQLENLTFLGLNGNPIESLYNIEGSDSLQSIYLDRTRITTLDGIEQFPNLVSISANSNELEDITAIKLLKKLRAIEIVSPINNLNEESLELLKRLKEENPDMYVEWEMNK